VSRGLLLENFNRMLCLIVLLERGEHILLLSAARQEPRLLSKRETRLAERILQSSFFKRIIAESTSAERYRIINLTITQNCSLAPRTQE
jgi:hypothetical protein